MAARIRLTAGDTIAVNNEDATLDLAAWTTPEPTALVNVSNATDAAAWVNPAGTLTGAPTGCLIPAGGSLTLGPLSRTDCELVIYCPGSGDIHYSFSPVFSEK